ncbi:hypothetical protein QNA24_22385 [Rhodococcus qingshengii]|uniref:hypothetical protein n=1 Tax=Rhodococcus qingshengii TaxID=334542 RepID=UPI0024BBA26A|nr:hypothetical protein [Rhodococcus qingshengii]MDJ0489129.1 hypothetical protein [Rhodococcus qingshengii]
MTDAPDPGLTDLIAAHTLRVVELNEAARYPECNGCDWVGGLVKDHAVHLASVVERHTNGRHEWPKTTPTGHTYERPTTYDELNGITADMAQGEIEGWEKTELPPEPTWPMVTLAQREIYRQSVRITELEATIARVRAVEAEYLDPEDADIECREDVWRFIRDLRAALEGES